MRLDAIAVYILALIGMINVLYDTGCWIYDRLMERRLKKHYKEAEEWLGKWGA